METGIITKQEVLGKQINVYGDIENPLFLAKDVASWLEHSDVSTMIHTVDEDEKVQMTNPNNACGGQGSWFLTENGLYEVFMLSRKSIAKQLKKGIKEMLHSVRLHGAYMTSETLEKALLSPDYLIKLATKLKEEKQKRIEAEKQNEILKPKAELMDKVLDSDQRIDIGQATKILGLPFGRNTLFKKLRDNVIFFKNRNEPKQIFIEKGLFLLKEKWIERDNHDGFTVIKVLVTQKGLDYLSRLFCTKVEKQQMAIFK